MNQRSVYFAAEKFHRKPVVDDFLGTNQVIRCSYSIEYPSLTSLDVEHRMYKEKC